MCTGVRAYKRNTEFDQNGGLVVAVDTLLLLVAVALGAGVVVVVVSVVVVLLSVWVGHAATF